MRSLLIIFFVFISLHLFAQVTVDTAVKQQFNAAYNRLSLREKESLAFTQAAIGAAVVTSYEIDTLNKGDLLPGNSDIPSQKGNYLFAMSVAYGDTFNIFISPHSDRDGMAMLSHTIINNKLRSNYSETGSAFRTGDIPVTVTKFVLSSNELKPGIMIYGYVEAATYPFNMETNNSKTEHIRRILKWKYYFRCDVKPIPKK